MALETLLFASPPKEWTSHQAIVFDWYDGPREGIVQLSSPACEFSFQLLSEKSDDDDLDDRLFRVSELPAGTVGKAMAILQSLGTPANRVWIPNWSFPSEQDRKTAEAVLDNLLKGKRETDLIVRTRDMQVFLGCWSATRNGVHARDWFATLGISA